MESILVNASKSYEVMIENGCLRRCGARLRDISDAETVALITDKNVDGLYANIAEDSLREAGFRVVKFVIQAGEASKNARTYLELLEFLAQNELTRADAVAALGGGVVGDLAGFAAATYLRGIDLLQLPTTLLAMVDSSVGGKTAIDLDCGKNLVGAFYQPQLVLCDTQTLDTLPQAVFSDGCAEVIKYGMIADAQLLTVLKTPLREQAQTVIARCVQIKRDLVEQDEFDNGVRQLLNFGHTVGHAIELLSAYRISHGRAVAIGMAAMTTASERSELCPDGLYWELHDLLTQYGLPTALPFAAADLSQAAFHDKKRIADTLRIVVPCSRGRCCVQQVTIEDFTQLLCLCEDATWMRP